ncbi:hypothetical protein AB0N09_33365 [Streptomyces erythrochromogenes]|uniref:hypothetical protein n=1 Tax=Streptomyces erythrochromogenes TaxID=285574 RepID=UPI0034185A14
MEDSMAELYPEFFEGPFWADGDDGLEAVWRVFEDQLDMLLPAVDGAPEDAVDTPVGGQPATESDRVAAALDATWAAMEQIESLYGPDEARPWMARTFLDSGILETVNPSPPPPVLEALTDIAARSPQAAGAWYPAEPATPHTISQWQQWGRAGSRPGTSRHAPRTGAVDGAMGGAMAAAPRSAPTRHRSTL